MIDTEHSAAAARFTRRLTIFEEPEVAEWLEQHASTWGRSLGAEIRSAIRYWRAANEEEGDTHER